MIKVYFKDGGFWDYNGCSCCEPDYFSSLNFSHIEGVPNPDMYNSYDYEIYNGSKSEERDCLLSVFWDLIADKDAYIEFYDLYEKFEDVEDSEIKLMLLSKGIEVIFLVDVS